MRASIFLIVAVASAAISHAAFAQPASATCASKRADIVRDIDEAKAKGQANRVRGLEKALRQTRANCSDARLQKEHAAHVARQEKKIVGRQRDLDTARAQGKADKIADRQAKLAKEQAELEKIRSTTR